MEYGATGEPAIRPVRSSRRLLSGANRISDTDCDDRSSGSLQLHSGQANRTISLDLIAQIAEYIAFPDNLSLLFIHPSVTRAIQCSLYRRLEIGVLTLVPDIAISRLVHTREVLCAGLQLIPRTRSIGARKPGGRRHWAWNSIPVATCPHSHIFDWRY
jgi:hypothetical protein